MNRLARLARDPFLASVVVLVALVVVGFVFVGVAWSATARTRPLVSQFSYLASAGMAGVAIIGFAVGLLGIQLRRRDEARRRAAYAGILDAAVELVDELSDRSRGGRR